MKFKCCLKGVNFNVIESCLAKQLFQSLYVCQGERTRCSRRRGRNIQLFPYGSESQIRRGTLEGADHTAVESLPFVINICLILTKATGRFGKNMRPNLERIASNFAVWSGKSNFSPSLSLNSIMPFKPSDAALVFAIASI